MIFNQYCIDDKFDAVIGVDFLTFICANYECLISQLDLKSKDMMLDAFKYQIEYYKSELHKHPILIIDLIKKLNVLLKKSVLKI